MSKPHVIIVGFGQGIGYGIARAFAKTGSRLSLLSRSLDKSRDQVHALIQCGAAVVAYSVDAGDLDGLTATIHRAMVRYGEPVALVFNVVSRSYGPPSHIEPSSLTQDFNTNVSAALASARAVLPGMRTYQAGNILFTGCGLALYPTREISSIGFCKAALRSLAFALADELDGTGVRAGIVTVMDHVQPDGPVDPLQVGEAFVDLCAQPTATFPVELVFTGAS